MFRERLPRTYELRDLAATLSSPDDYFQHFEDNLKNPDGLALHCWDTWEKTFQGLDADAWNFLKQEASPHLGEKDKKGRGWRPLFDILNQARAYNGLIKIGCSSVRFISRSSGRRIQTPDLEASLGSVAVLCEAKTINISEKEVHARHNFGSSELSSQLSEGFLRKLELDIKSAEDQLQAHDPIGQARHYIYFVVCFDDWVGDCQSEYFQQIDQCLLNNLHPNVELVFQPDRDLFKRNCPMRAATLVTE